MSARPDKVAAMSTTPTYIIMMMQDGAVLRAEGCHSGLEHGFTHDFHEVAKAYTKIFYSLCEAVESLVWSGTRVPPFSVAIVETRSQKICFLVEFHEFELQIPSTSQCVSRCA